MHLPSYLPTSCTPEGVFEVLVKVALVLPWFSLKCTEVRFFYLGLLSSIYESQDCRGRGRGHFFNSSQPFSHASLTSWGITADSSPLQIASNREPLVTTNHLTTRPLHLQPLSIFYSGKGKITPLSSKNIKRISEKLKNIQCCRSAILEICNIA